MRQTVSPVSVVLIGLLWAASGIFAACASENGADATVANLPKGKVGSTPDVNIVNTPRVIVANTTPLPVQPGFPPGFQPFITNVVLTATNGGWGGHSAPFTVPAGKMLVIEQVNARIDLPYGQSIGSFALTTQSLQGVGGIFFIAAQPQAIESNTGASTFVANSPIHIYVTPQSTVLFTFDRRSPEGDSKYGYVTVAGYLVDSPGSAN
jgi:hypothetical protein